MGLLSSKLGHKNGNGEFFAAAEPNSNFFVLSGIKIEKTGPETAKISPKMAKKAIFDHFSVKYGSFHLKTGSKERQR